MSLSDLPASELARIDAVCMEYESLLRAGQSPSIDELVARHGGAQETLLRKELQLVRDELESEHSDLPKTGPPPRGESPRGESLRGESLRGESLNDSKGPSPYPEANTSIGHFLVEALIGRGGMGMVFSAVDQRLDRKVAIKMLAVQAANRKELSERFDREARALAALTHPNIVELFDVGVFNGLPYAVMEYLDGELLSKRLQSELMTSKQVRWLGASIADALAVAHEAGVVHRDLKPENVMLLKRVNRSVDPSQQEDAQRVSEQDWMAVKLFDFGLSRAPLDGFGDKHQPGADSDGDLSQTGEGVILGTPGYMAPEQARGEKVTPLADVFSLGCVLFESFYGHRPFDGRTFAKRFAATLYHQPETDPERRLVDRDLANLIDQCLSKDPSRRPQSAMEVARRLRQSNHDRTLLRATNRRRWMIAGSLTAVGVASSAFWMRRDRETLSGIRSLAVLSIMDGDEEPAASPDDLPRLPAPIGQMPLGRGEQISALLVHELTRLSDLSVPRFRPLVAETPEQFRLLGERLEVDALLTGSLRTIEQGEATFAEIDLQIVSATTGNQLWGRRLQSDAPDNLLQQSKLVHEIASVIGHRLTSTADESAPPTVDSFRCLVDGQTRSDPDSPAGLEMALKCFQRAKQVDRRFVEPVAGLALTSITLAAQTEIERAMELVRQARENVEEALGLDPSSVDARLAAAMLDWQTVGRFDHAERTMRELVLVAPNHWQIRHQFGLLLLTLGQTSEAIESLRQAQLLNPLSVIAKVDAARARWVSGDSERAIADAKLVAQRYQGNELARGLLVDLHEQLQQYDLAAAELGLEGVTGTTRPADYFEQREPTLMALPYGPFGKECNAAILDSRLGKLDDESMAKLSDPLPPMLTFLLAVHPALSQARLLPRAVDLLPKKS